MQNIRPIALRLTLPERSHLASEQVQDVQGLDCPYLTYSSANFYGSLVLFEIFWAAEDS